MLISEAAEAYAEHLLRVRRLSENTVRAYRNDLVDLAAASGDIELEEVDIEVLRDWVWRASERGDARSTLARRTATARGFFAWATERGAIASDPALRLASPKRARTLPKVATAQTMAAVLDDLRVRAADGDPVLLRDHAILELLYATGIRVSELCGLDLDDVDSARRTARVTGKGEKTGSFRWAVRRSTPCRRTWCAGARCSRRAPRAARGRHARCSSAHGEAG